MSEPALVEVRLADPIGPDQFDEDGNPTPQLILADLIVQALVGKLLPELQKAVVAEVQDRVAGKVDEAVDGWIREALAEPIRQTNEWGRPKGEPISLPEYVKTEIDHWLTKGDGYERQTKMQKLIRDEVDRAVADDLTGAIREARQAVVTRVGTQAGRLLAEAIKTANLLDGVR
jgi:hypothetical protein